MTAPYTERWNVALRLLHWAVALIVVEQYATGWLSEAAANRGDRILLIRTHYQFGMLLAGLIVLRVLWRLATTSPMPVAGTRMERMAAKAVHMALYCALIVLPISGYLIWIHMGADMSVFGVVEIPKLITPNPDDERLRAVAWYVHFAAGWTLAGLTFLHLSAAMVHAVRGDAILRRML